MYQITGSTLHIPDPMAFGFDGPDLQNAEFSIISDEYHHDRRSYTIRLLVIKHTESGRFFSRTYSTHEDEGSEWEPGMGRDMALDWTEVYPHEVTTIVYKPSPAQPAARPGIDDLAAALTAEVSAMDPMARRIAAREISERFAAMADE